jgi:hypothetical protein
MAQLDWTITDAEYDQMVVVLDGIRSRLGLMKSPLTEMFQQETGRQKIKAFATTDAGRFLREVNKIRNDINKYFDDIGWKDNG